VQTHLNNGTNKLEARLLWVEFVKAFALVWILINHLSELYFGFPLIANPTADWSSLSDRIAQLAPLAGFGLWNLPINIFRYVGWFGDQGVQLFIIVGGFGLTWGYLSLGQDAPLSKKEFFIKRAFRLYPLWWGSHLFFVAVWLLTGWGLSLADKSFYLSFLGIRFTPELFYYFSPAWWYFGLILQLYLVYPLLWDGLRRIGPSRLLILTMLVSFPLRALGLLVLDGYLDIWQRGAVFITRLPEFVFGICFAVWLHQNPEMMVRRVRTVGAIISLIVGYIIGLFLALTLIGMTFAPFLLGMSVFVLLYITFGMLIPKLPNRVLRLGEWVGQHSYSLYLIHHPVFLRLITVGTPSIISISIRSLIALILTVVIAIAVEWGTAWVVQNLQYRAKTSGLSKTVSRSVLIGVVVVALLISGELLVRQSDPQEILGWGERPSLQQDEILGWRLIPSQTTRLRWQSYDYEVSANELGFPGPDFPVEKPAGTFRILVTGDAFTSAEGVDTDQAWPRLLQARLSEDVPGNAEVMNFAVTGYGPNQYAAVIERYVPIYKPDLIILEVFVNDFLDVQISNEQFYKSIGFNQPDPAGLYSIARLEHLRKYIKINVAEQLGEKLLNRPNTTGYFLGGFVYFEKDQSDFMLTGSIKVAEKLDLIRSVAEQNGSELMMVVAPAPIQVCDPGELEYFPGNVDFGDTSIYDHDLPNRLFDQITNELGIVSLDLREAFQLYARCLYQRRNLHWGSDGHQAVSDYLAEVLRNKGYIP